MLSEQLKDDIKKYLKDVDTLNDNASYNELVNFFYDANTLLVSVMDELGYGGC